MNTKLNSPHTPDPNPVILTISGVSTDGRGIARFEERAVFVEHCLPGDVVRAKVAFNTKPPSAEVIEHIERSPDRVTHPCPHAADCPACPFGEWDYEKQLAAKTDLVQRTLSKQLGEIEVRRTIASPKPWHYRNRVSLRLEQEQDRVTAGYRQGPRNTASLPLMACKLASPEIDPSIGELQKLLEGFRGGITDKLPVRLQLHSTTTGPGMLIVFPLRIHASQRKFWRNWLSEMTLPGGIWFATGNRAGALSAKSLIEPDQGAEPILTSYMGEPLKIHPGSFCQANAEAAELVGKRIAVWSHRHNFSTIWDLYGGYGSLGFAASSKSSSLRILESAKWSQSTASTLSETAVCKDMKFYLGDVLKEFRRLSREIAEKDLVILDPPSSGVHRDVLSLLIESNVRKLCYLSCNPAKLARDLAILHEGGFEATEIQPYDFFPQTASIEVLTLLSR